MIWRKAKSSNNRKTPVKLCTPDGKKHISIKIECIQTRHSVINMLCHDITHRVSSTQPNVQHLFLIHVAAKLMLMPLVLLLRRATAMALDQIIEHSCRVAISQHQHRHILTRCKQFSTVITVHSRTWIYWLNRAWFSALWHRIILMYMR